jgi:hypothetical protein
MNDLLESNADFGVEFTGTGTALAIGGEGV